MVGLDGGGEVESAWGTIVVCEEVSGWGGEGAELRSDWDGLGEMVGIKTRGREEGVGPEIGDDGGKRWG